MTTAFTWKYGHTVENPAGVRCPVYLPMQRGNISGQSSHLVILFPAKQLFQKMGSRRS